MTMFVIMCNNKHPNKQCFIITSSNPLMGYERWGPLSVGCLAGRCASLCLQAAHGGCAIGGSG